MEEIVLTYNYPIVIISILIAVFASFTTIELIGRTNKSTKHRQVYLILSAVTMGFGIWGMHFTGMMAIGNGEAFKYDVVTTTGSWLVATIASYFAFYIITNKKSSYLMLAIASILLGMGIVSMHFLGMSGIMMPGVMEYNYRLVALSMMLAILGSLLVLFVFAKVDEDYLYIYQFPLATLLGLTVSGMHYTAMEAVSIYQNNAKSSHFFDVWSVAVNPDTLLIFLVVIASVMFLTVNTISLRNRSFQNKINYMAFHDSLTGLPNRNLLNQQLEVALTHCKKEHKKLAVLFLDLNDFKEVNDSFGHEAGDTILKQVAERLVDSLRDEDIVARLGGDEFIIVIEEVNETLVKEVVGRILSSFEEPFVFEEKSFVITPSIGVSLYPQDAPDTKTLIQQADQAMYHAKNHTNDTVQYNFYEQVSN